MIKAINISPLNTTNKLLYVCEICGYKGDFILTKSINIYNEGKIDKDEVYDCQNCSNRL